jgi:hypothetical protein
MRFQARVYSRHRFTRLTACWASSSQRSATSYALQQLLECRPRIGLHVYVHSRLRSLAGCSRSRYSPPRRSTSKRVSLSYVRRCHGATRCRRHSDSCAVSAPSELRDSKRRWPKRAVSLRPKRRLPARARSTDSGGLGARLQLEREVIEAWAGAITACAARWGAPSAEGMVLPPPVPFFQEKESPYPVDELRGLQPIVAARKIASWAPDPDEDSDAAATGSPRYSENSLRWAPTAGQPTDAVNGGLQILKLDQGQWSGRRRRASLEFRLGRCPSPPCAARSRRSADPRRSRRDAPEDPGGLGHTIGGAESPAPWSSSAGERGPHSRAQRSLMAELLVSWRRSRAVRADGRTKARRASPRTLRCRRSQARGVACRTAASMIRPRSRALVHGPAAEAGANTSRSLAAAAPPRDVRAGQRRQARWRELWIAAAMRQSDAEIETIANRLYEGGSLVNPDVRA